MLCANTYPFVFLLRNIQEKMLSEANENVKKMFSLHNASQAEINKVAVHEAMAKFRRSDVDTGSPEAQSMCTVSVACSRVMCIYTDMSVDHRSVGTHAVFLSYMHKAL